MLDHVELEKKLKSFPPPLPTGSLSSCGCPPTPDFDDASEYGPVGLRLLLSWRQKQPAYSQDAR